MNNRFTLILLLFGAWGAAFGAATIKLDNATVQLDGPYAKNAELLIVQAEKEDFIWLTGTVVRVGDETKALSVSIALKGAAQIGQLTLDLKDSEKEKTFAEKIIIPTGAISRASVDHQLIFSETIGKTTSSLDEIKFRRTVTLEGLRKDATFLPVTRAGNIRQVHWRGISNPLAEEAALPAHASLQLNWGNYQTSISVANGGTFDATQDLNDVAPQRGKLMLDLAGALAEIPDVDGGVVVLGVGDHVDETLRKNVKLYPGSGGRIWFWQQNQWMLYDRGSLGAPVVVFLIDAWRNASMTRGTEAIGVVLAQDPTPSLIDPELLATGRLVPVAEADETWKRSVQGDIESTATPAAVLWCVGGADAKVRTWRVLADAFVVANEESEFFREKLRAGLLENILKLFPGAPGAGPALHIAIPPSIAANAPTYLDPKQIGDRLAIQAVTNALSYPTRAQDPRVPWLIAVPLPHSGVSGRDEVESSLLAAALGLHIAAQCDLPSP